MSQASCSLEPKLKLDYGQTVLPKTTGQSKIDLYNKYNNGKQKYRLINFFKINRKIKEKPLTNDEF